MIHLDQTRKKQETKDLGMSVNLLLAPLTAAHLYGQNMRARVRAHTRALARLCDGSAERQTGNDQL